MDMEQVMQQQTLTYKYSAELSHSKSGSNHVVIIKSLRVYSDDPTQLVEMTNGLLHQLTTICDRANGE